MKIIILCIILFIIGTVMSLKNNKNKNLTSVGIFVLVISIFMFWIVTSWFALLPTIIGVCILFGVIFGGNQNRNSNDFDPNLKITKNLDGSAIITENIIDYVEKPPHSNYFSSVQKFTEAHGDDEKISELENSLKSFPAFVSFSLKNDKELPPYVPVRDTLPELYMRRGDWNKAEEVIKLCTFNNAYGYTDYSKSKKGIWISETDENELLTLQNRGETAVIALQYLSENPGTLQKDIYKISELSSCDHDALVWFCRNSRQIRKEKEVNTNRLYAVD